MLKVKSVKVKGCGFTGFVIIDGLEVRLEGEYDVKFKNRYPVVKIEYIEGDGFGNIDTNEIDINDLECQILETDDGTWWDDYCDAEMERRDVKW